jgi:hypothetical protein
MAPFPADLANCGCLTDEEGHDTEKFKCQVNQSVAGMARADRLF